MPIETLEEALAEIERLKNVLHVDRSCLAAALSKCMDIAASWSWVAEGRGSYEWDDAEYQKETGHMIDKILTHAKKSLEESGNVAHAECCGHRKPPDSEGKLKVEKAALDRIEDRLEKGIDCDDPRVHGGGFYIYPAGGVQEKNGKAVLETSTINDKDEYFELTCELKQS